MYSGVGSLQLLSQPSPCAYFAHFAFAIVFTMTHVANCYSPPSVDKMWGISGSYYYISEIHILSTQGGLYLMRKATSLLALPALFHPYTFSTYFPSGGGFPKLGVPTMMENQMEKNMENEMDTGIIGDHWD